MIGNEIYPFIAIPLGDAIWDALHNDEQCPEGSPEDKKLSNGEIDKLKDAGIDPHELKPKKGGSKFDLFKDKNGNIIVKPKKGNGPGDPTGLNINNF